MDITGKIVSRVEGMDKCFGDQMKTIHFTDGTSISFHLYAGQDDMDTYTNLEVKSNGAINKD